MRAELVDEKVCLLWNLDGGVIITPWILSFNVLAKNRLLIAFKNMTYPLAKLNEEDLGLVSQFLASLKLLEDSLHGQFAVLSMDDIPGQLLTTKIIGG